jgi:hypothetical protein
VTRRLDAEELAEPWRSTFQTVSPGTDLEDYAVGLQEAGFRIEAFASPARPEPGDGTSRRRQIPMFLLILAVM